MARDKPFADIFDLFISDTKKVENIMNADPSSFVIVNFSPYKNREIINAIITVILLIIE